MNLLLDTHALIWFVEGDDTLPEKVKIILNNEKNTVMISIASLWEMVIKISLDKLTIAHSFEQVLSLIYSNGFEILPILPLHLNTLLDLSFFHRDPFDRILAAQSLAENIVLVSKDEIFDSYRINRIWN
jgi:PIN domain nuclease of toxin-antitoxin system